ncbi:MAG: hypothetical protein KDK48_03155, partial [Chlamydiia bacterium]|nr:hypothetical protein [Chlamydiia bacterium]
MNISGIPQEVQTVAERHYLELLENAAIATSNEVEPLPALQAPFSLSDTQQSLLWRELQSSLLYYDITLLDLIGSACDSKLRRLRTSAVKALRPAEEALEALGLTVGICYVYADRLSLLQEAPRLKSLLHPSFFPNKSFALEKVDALMKKVSALQTKKECYPLKTETVALLGILKKAIHHPDALNLLKNWSIRRLAPPPRPKDSTPTEVSKSVAHYLTFILEIVESLKKCGIAPANNSEWGFKEMLALIGEAKSCPEILRLEEILHTHKLELQQTAEIYEQSLADALSDSLTHAEWCRSLNITPLRFKPQDEFIAMLLAGVKYTRLLVCYNHDVNQILHLFVFFPLFPKRHALLKAHVVGLAILNHLIEQDTPSSRDALNLDERALLQKAGMLDQTSQAFVMLEGLRSILQMHVKEKNLPRLKALSETSYKLYEWQLARQTISSAEKLMNLKKVEVLNLTRSLVKVAASYLKGLTRQEHLSDLFAFRKLFAEHLATRIMDLYLYAVLPGMAKTYLQDTFFPDSLVSHTFVSETHSDLVSLFDSHFPKELSDAIEVIELT